MVTIKLNLWKKRYNVFRPTTNGKQGKDFSIFDLIRYIATQMNKSLANRWLF